MKVIILAAGQGKRLKNYTNGKPKCLLTIGKETIIERQVRILNECGINRADIYILAGYAHELLENQMENVIVNNEYDKKENSYSLGLALKNIPKDDVIVLDGDLVFENKIIEEVLNSKEKNVIMTKEENDLSESTGIKLSSNGYVEEIGKHIKNSGFVYISIFKFSKVVINDFLTELLNEKYEHTWYTSPLTAILKKHRFKNLVTKYKWHEIDFVEDYEETKKMFNLGE